MKHRSYINNHVANTLVEHNGELRPGNMADIESVSWKAVRNDQEHAFAGAKQGWLDRMNRNATKSWGRAPPRIPRLQQPIPLPSAEMPSAVSTSVDEDIITGDVVAANVDDVTGHNVETQASALPPTSETSPDDLSTSQEATMSASSDVAESLKAKVEFNVETPNVESDECADMIQATNIENTSNSKTNSQAAVVEPPLQSTEMSSIDVSTNQENVDQLSTTTAIASELAENSNAKEEKTK